jgi:molybdopterin converting factor small subunit
MCGQDTGAKSITVRFYAEFRRVAGVNGIDLESDGCLTVRQALTEVMNRAPALRGEIEPVLAGKEPTASMLIMVGSQIATRDSVVWPGDEVRLLPPMSGG